ncbi:hypothetical protein JB92DRAFT_9878 [Gautieria morchelliformis]|nr:hypothetical protein JB92DRAFT_9878 [Gautieria morchelliformis]
MSHIRAHIGSYKWLSTISFLFVSGYSNVFFDQTTSFCVSDGAKMLICCTVDASVICITMGDEFDSHNGYGTC